MAKKETSRWSKARRWSFRELSVLVVASILLGYSFPNEFTMIHLVKQTDTSDVVRVESTHLRLQRGSHGPTKPTGPQICWLMSYPNSGTSYTLKMISTLTETQVGSNYATKNLGGTRNESIPIFKDQPSGPFVVDPAENPEFEIPSKYLLTKTHCGGRCERCGPTRYTETTYSFRQRCLKSKWAKRSSDGSLSEFRSYYGTDRLSKAVHLIRNPFDNVVSRFHLERKIGRGGQIGRDYPSTREGFRSFCTFLNDEYYEVEIKAVWMTPELDQLTSGIPCRADFMRYVEWHNQAVVTTNDLGLETYILKYNWYETRFNQTTKELLEFLELSQAAEPWEFEVGKRYADEYFTKDERNRMGLAMQYMASPKVWELLRGYFA